jgi:hypothetical protein
VRQKCDDEARARRRAAPNPACVRSRIKSRSISNKAARTWKKKDPVGVTVSIVYATRRP